MSGLRKRKRVELKADDSSDIHRQNVQRARAVARMAVFDELSSNAREAFRRIGTPAALEPDDDQICEAVGQLGAYFDDERRLRIPGRED